MVGSLGLCVCVIYEIFVYFRFPALVVFGFVSSILAKRLIGRLEEHLQMTYCVSSRTRQSINLLSHVASFCSSCCELPTEIFQMSCGSMHPRILSLWWRRRLWRKQWRRPANMSNQRSVSTCCCYHYSIYMSPFAFLHTCFTLWTINARHVTRAFVIGQRCRRWSC